MGIKKNQKVGDRKDVMVIESNCRYVFYIKDNGGVQIAVSSPSPELEEQVDLHNAVSAQKFHIQPELVFEYDDIAAFGKVATAFFDTYQSMLSDMTPKIQA